MKNWSTYIFLLVAGALSLLATSCSQEDEGLESVLVSNGKATVQFSIALGNSGAGSRANETWNDPYNPDGSDNGESIFENFENKINLGQFHVNLIIPGTPSTTIPVQIIQRLDNTDDHQYTFKGEVRVDNPKSLVGAKIEVCANINENESIFYAYYSEDSENPNRKYYSGKGVEYMPMWGVHTITEDLLLAASYNIDLTPTDPIYLLRSMAKVEINFNNLPTNYKILGVSLSKHNYAGNLRPNGNYDNTDSYFREECINVPNKDNTDYITVTPELAFSKVEENRYIIYVPEFEFNTTDSKTNNDDLFIKVMIDKNKNDGKDVDNSSDFKSKGEFSVVNNANGKNPNWVRNHWYVYNVNVDTDVNFDYEVVDFPTINNGSLDFGYADGNAHNRQ